MTIFFIFPFISISPPTVKKIGADCDDVTLNGDESSQRSPPTRTLNKRFHFRFLNCERREKEAREKVRGACLIFRESCDLEEVLENLISNQE